MTDLAVLCDCDFSENSKIINQCSYCKIREKENRWDLEINTVRKCLNELDSTYVLSIRIELITKLFEFLLSRAAFMAYNYKFRLAILKKIDEMSEHQEAGKLNKIFDKMKIFIVELSNHPEYKE
jgi:hypothetical protein